MKQSFRLEETIQNKTTPRQLLSATSFCRTRQINPKGCGLLQALTMCTTKYYNTLRLARVKIPSPRKHFIISWVYKPKVPNTNLLEPRKQWSMKIFILKQNTREPLFHRPLASVRNSNLFSPRKHSR